MRSTGLVAYRFPPTNQWSTFKVQTNQRSAAAHAQYMACFIYKFHWPISNCQTFTIDQPAISCCAYAVYIMLHFKIPRFNQRSAAAHAQCQFCSCLATRMLILWKTVCSARACTKTKISLSMGIIFVWEHILGKKTSARARPGSWVVPSGKEREGRESGK